MLGRVRSAGAISDCKPTKQGSGQRAREGMTKRTGGPWGVTCSIPCPRTPNSVQRRAGPRNLFCKLGTWTRRMFVSANNAYNAEYREIIGAKLPESDFICLGGKYLVFLLLLILFIAVIFIIMIPRSLNATCCLLTPSFKTSCVQSIQFNSFCH